MSSDLSPDESSPEMTPKKAPAQILEHEIEEGTEALERPAGQLFVSALSGGLDVGFSLFLMAVVLTLAPEKSPTLVNQLLVANMYAIGFIFVVLGRSELFTEQTTLAVLPVLNGQASLGALLRLWGVIYAANLLGAAAFAGLATLTGPALGVIDPRAFGGIARRLTGH